MAKRKKSSGQTNLIPSPDCADHGRHRVLDDEVAGARLDEVAKKVTEAIAKQEARAERRRAEWFARMIAQLALDYGEVLFQEKDFLIWLTEPHKELANQSPAAFMWREEKTGFKKVKLLLDRMESGGFA